MREDRVLGRKLKILREFKNISREDFANLLNKKFGYQEGYSGFSEYFSETKVYNYEIGNRKFTIAFLKACCEILDVHINIFFEDIDKILSNNSDNFIFDNKNIMLLRLKFNNLIKILDKLSDKKISDKFLHLLETLEKEENKK